MPKKQRPSNIEFVTDIMEHSKYGALAQLFVLDALEKWSAIVAEADPRKFTNAMIDGEAWVGVAKEIQSKIEARYKDRK